jgi:hypothetical protein
VGPPLARAEHELPSFGRAALAFITGTAMLLTFAGLVIAAFIESKSGPIGFWAIVTAGEIAAWRVKWEALFACVIALLICATVVRSVFQNPSRFIGLLAAQIGLGQVLTLIFMVAALIGITIPERLRQRQDSINAAITARGHTLDLAFFKYRELHGTFPTDPDKYIQDLRTLPDPDGSIAEALQYLDANGYALTAKLASGPVKSKPSARPVALRNADGPSNPEPPGLSFPSYEVRLPNEHRWFADDEYYIMKDGVIYKSSDPAVRSSTVRRTTP